MALRARQLNPLSLEHPNFRMRVRRSRSTRRFHILRPRNINDKRRRELKAPHLPALQYERRAACIGYCNSCPRSTYLTHHKKPARLLDSANPNARGPTRQPIPTPEIGALHQSLDVDASWVPTLMMSHRSVTPLTSAGSLTCIPRLTRTGAGHGCRLSRPARHASCGQNAWND